MAHEQSIGRSPGFAEHAYWALATDQLIGQLVTSASGLSSLKAASRRAKFGRNALTLGSGGSAMAVFVRQLRSALGLVIVFAAAVSGFVGEGHEAAIIGAIVLASCILSFTQEYGASRAMEALQERISRKAT
ncbi:magnesium-translocating P-type ATPase, partial [Mesorhizobium sp. M8A.F.Ca.ET.167.01.1.1]